MLITKDVVISIKFVQDIILSAKVIYFKLQTLTAPRFSKKEKIDNFFKNQIYLNLQFFFSLNLSILELIGQCDVKVQTHYDVTIKIKNVHFECLNKHRYYHRESDSSDTSHIVLSQPSKLLFLYIYQLLWCGIFFFSIS